TSTRPPGGRLSPPTAPRPAPPPEPPGGRSRSAANSAAGRPGSTTDLSAFAGEKRDHVGGVEPEEVAVHGHLQRAHRQASLEAELQRSIQQTPYQTGHECIACPHAVDGFHWVAAALDRNARARCNRARRATR